MVEKFKENLDNTESRPRILAAVSGGVDSMVMASLLHACYNNDFAIATVNFRLRAQESDADQQLVVDWAKEKRIRIFTTNFNTSEYACEKGISIEMAARELRYTWFYKIMDEEGFDILAIAHNLNDSVETLLLNILRGTGIDGLCGIKQRTGRILRPLLNFSRAEIVRYAQRESVPFREDSTNKEDQYSRNRIRNRVFPEFQVINPSFLRTVERDMSYFSEAGEIIRKLYHQVRSDVVDEGGSRTQLRIRIDKLLSQEHSRYWLYMLLNEYGFNSAQSDQVHESLVGQPGKEFHSPDYILIKDREYLLIYSREGQGVNQPEPNQRVIEKPVGGILCIEVQGVRVSFRLYHREADFLPVPSKCKFFMDASKIVFPLLCRVWKEGDRFIPLGMTGFKKLSDLFTDEKIDIKSKEHQLVLSAGENIVVVLGHRIDDRFKITPGTTEILEVDIN